MSFTDDKRFPGPSRKPAMDELETLLNFALNGALNPRSKHDVTRILISIGAEMGMRLVMEHPEYARHLYQRLDPDCGSGPDCSYRMSEFIRLNPIQEVS